MISRLLFPTAREHPSSHSFHKARGLHSCHHDGRKLYIYPLSCFCSMLTCKHGSHACVRPVVAPHRVNLGYHSKLGETLDSVFRPSDSITDIAFQLKVLARFAATEP